MTRKRFVKLLMSSGISRNDATLYAGIVRKAYLSYKSVMIRTKDYERRLEG